MKKKILITGGAGFIGSMLTTKLVSDGHFVTVIDKFEYNKNSLNHLHVQKNFVFIEGNIHNKKKLQKLVKQNEFIIPLAALVGAPLCKKNFEEATKTNFIQIKNILKYKTKNQKIIYLNSNSGYGVGEKNKFCDEASPLNPISHYGITKVNAEKLVVKSKNFISFRLATVFGYSYRMRTDLLVNFFVKTALEKSQLKLFEPHFRRNFIHVRDVVEAINFSIKNFSKLKNQVYNLGLSEANVTKIQLAKKIKKYYKKMKIKIIKGIKDPDQRDYFVSNKKIERKGFKARFSLDDGIKELLQALKHQDQNQINNY